MTAVPDTNVPFSITHSSPLDTLVRRTSSRAARARAATHSASDKASRPVYPPAHPLTNPHDPKPYQEPLRPGVALDAPPHSPLLHGRFARDSTATSFTNDNRSYFDDRSTFDSRSFYQESEYQYYDDEHMYSPDPVMDTAPALRDSWSSENLFMNPRPAPTLPSPYPSNPSVPTVVVSSAEPAQQLADGAYGGLTNVSQPQPAGRAPVVRPVTSNFSRPARRMPSPELAPPDSSVKPPRPSSEDEDRKREVLERNRRGQTPADRTPPQRYPLSSQPVIARGTAIPSDQGAYAQITPVASAHARNPSDSSPATPSRNGIPWSLSPGASPTPQYGTQSAGSQYNGSVLSTQSKSADNVFYPGRPPSLRPGSSGSVYSNYSYYQYDSAAPSPVGSGFPPHDKRNQAGSPSPKPPVSPQPELPLTEQTAKTPQDFLQLGIAHHEANRLTESAACFEKSAKLGGGCAMGMLMWGLTLRHGWGRPKDEEQGFKWLRRAAELAVTGLEGAGGTDTTLFRGELILAIYEVGQCFFQGWGVAKDQKMAVKYYTTAANLGDPDAQCDLAYCLLNGKGCKKDRKEAAKWYRAAVAQGSSAVGLAWIYKEKYQ
ncbi:hypothetical protein AX16_000545 [Volvariella volvacea WC 439]|nr:hypothetical protein AX16_000545 [Volvariella volvacea WC 439]